MVNFENLTYSEKAQYFINAGYIAVKELPDGRIIGIMNMLFTTDIAVNLIQSEYEYRYCYDTPQQAMDEFVKWNGEKEPKNYIKKK